VDSSGTAWVAWDSYDPGSYDVLLRPITGEVPGPITEIAASPRFEARPSVAVDGEGRVWVAYEVGEAGWGKDIPEILRNEDWNYAVFTPEKKPRPGVNQADCLACHKPLDKVSFTFSLEAMAKSR